MHPVFIAASDPLVQPAPHAFTTPVTPGVYPVQIAIARLQGGDERIAFARACFGPALNAAVETWRMALTGQENLASLDAAEGYFGYGVDAGIGCFMDADAGKLLQARMDADEDYFETLLERLHLTYKHTRSWLDFRPDDTSPLNIVCFSSGWGRWFPTPRSSASARVRPKSRSCW